MSKLRRNHKKEFKAKLVLEAIRGEISISELASTYGLHPNQICHWKKKVLEQLPNIFLDQNNNNELKSLEKEND